MCFHKTKEKSLVSWKGNRQTQVRRMGFEVMAGSNFCVLRMFRIDRDGVKLMLE